MLKKFVYILCIYMKSNFAFSGRFLLTKKAFNLSGDRREALGEFPQEP